MKILIVEGESVIGQVVFNTLIKMGYNPLPVVSCGKAAEEVAVREIPDLVIMDNSLQNETEGADAVRVILQKKISPVIFITNQSDKTEIKEAIELPSTGSLLSPEREIELHSLIENAVRCFQLEKKVKELRMKYESFFNSCNAGIVTFKGVFDSSGRLNSYTILETNSTFRSFLKQGGVKQKDLQPKELMDIFFKKFVETYEQFVEMQTPVYFKIYFPLIEKKFKASTFLLEDGICTVNFCDVTEEMREMRILEFQGAMDMSLSKAENFRQTVEIIFDHILSLETIDGAAVYRPDSRASKGLRLIGSRNLSTEYLRLPPVNCLSIAEKGCFRSVEVNGTSSAIGFFSLNHSKNVIAYLYIVGKERSEFSPRIYKSIGRVVSNVGSSLDVIMAKDALLKSKEMFRTVIDNVPYNICALNAEGEIVFSNRKLSTFLNMDIVKLIGRRLETLMRGKFRVNNEQIGINKMLDIAEEFHLDNLEYTDVSGGVHYFDFISAPFDLPDLEQSGILCVAIEVTEKRIQQQELIHAGRLTALGELVAGVAHEISNPNQVISLNTSIVKGFAEQVFSCVEDRWNSHIVGLDENSCIENIDDIYHGLNRIQESSKRIKSIVDELKEFSSKDNVIKMSKININEAAKSAIKLIHSQIKNSTSIFEMELGQDIPPMLGNFQQIEQVFVNLIQNSCQSLPNKNSGIRIFTFFKKDKNVAVIRIEDEGTGIPPEYIKKVAEPFFTTRRSTGGTGLGLSISYKIIMNHNGTIEFYSTPGESTVVVVKLPVILSCED